MNSSKPLTGKEFHEQMQNFIGSQTLYFQDSAIGRIEYTDGIHFLIHHGCSWLIEDMARYQTDDFKAADDRQFWKLRVHSDRSATLTCDDGNGNIRVTQEIEFTDFPMSKLDIYVEIKESLFLCLMSEY